MVGIGVSHWPVAVAAGLLVFVIGCNRSDDVTRDRADTRQTQQLTSLQQQRQLPATELADPPAKKVVDEWFKIYQAALSDLTLTKGHWETRKDANGKEERVWVQPDFGMTRIPRMRGHNVSMSVKAIGDSNKLKSLLADAELYGHVWGFGAATAVLAEGNLRMKLREFSHPVDEPQIEGQADLKAVSDFANQSLAKLSKGDIPHMKLREWDVQARLMRLTDKACLTCHVDSKLNDPVSVFVFATKPK